MWPVVKSSCLVGALFGMVVLFMQCLTIYDNIFRLIQLRFIECLSSMQWPGCLDACLPACLHVCSSTQMPDCLHKVLALPAFLHAFLPTCSSKNPASVWMRNCWYKFALPQGRLGM